jgi:hypothetical protein
MQSGEFTRNPMEPLEASSSRQGSPERVHKARQQHWVLIEYYKGKEVHGDRNQTHSEEGNEKGRDVSLEGTFSSDIIASRVRLPEKGQLPRIILLAGACRTGTTSQFRSFGETGVGVYNNHIKSIVRGLRRGREFKIPSVEEAGQTILIKESIGAKTPAESQLNPLKVLLDAKYPPEKLAVIVTSRCPLSTWASWCEKYSGVERMTLLNNFLTAHDRAFTLYQEAKAAGIATTALVYEAFRDNDPPDVMKRLFSNVSLPYSDQAIQGWPVITHPKDLPSHIHIYNHDSGKSEVPPQYIKGLMQVFSTKGLEYKEKSVDKIAHQITEEEVALLEKAPVFGQYDQLRQATSTDLRIPVPKTDEVNRYKSQQKESKS